MNTALDAWRMTDPRAWNAFVESAPYGSFPQLWEWGELRAAAGWRPIRLAVGHAGGEPLAGVQLLLRPMPVLGWSLAYAPRGPIGHLDDPLVRDALLGALRGLGRDERIATVRADPEVTASAPYGAALLEPPWRAAPKIQPPTTRIIDLAAGEATLHASMRSKHRQYVGKAGRDGVTVDRIDPADAPEAIAAALDDFNRIYRDTAERTGFVARQPAYYERAWVLFAPSGHAWLRFARFEGERVAVLFGYTCGDRAVEAYGGMTDRGASVRANYLLKWSAIVDFARDGHAVYDMWGLATGGIRQFKEGFGGEEVGYVGARDLALRTLPDTLLRIGLPAHGAFQRARLRLRGRSTSPPGEGA